MTYRKVNYEEVEQVSSAMHVLSDPLETEQVGVTVARCDPGWKSKPHDHTDNDHEEIYVLIEGKRRSSSTTNPSRWKPATRCGSRPRRPDRSATVTAKARSFS